MKKNYSDYAVLKILSGIFLIVFGMTMSGHSFADSSFSYIKNNLDGSQTLTGHVPSQVKKSTFKYHANIYINAQIILPLANQSQLSSFLRDLYDPKSPSYHHFLTPAQFALQFASSTVDSIFVQEFLKKQGIFVLGQSANGSVLNVNGPVPVFEHAFGLHINIYQKSDGTLFFAPDADPTIPANLAGKILAVGGLDNLPKYHAHHQRLLKKVLPKTVGSGPGGYLAPSDVKTAYNLNSVVSTGIGQNVALFELDGYASKDITAYESYFGLSNVPLQNVLIDGFNGVPNYGSNGGADEVTLDIELVAAFAPGSNNIYVYEAPNTTQSWIDEWNRIATDNIAKVISCSWGEPEFDSPTLSFDNSVFQQMAAQGQAVFVAAGDNGAFDAGDSTLAVDEPASQPYATAVGISTLTTNSNGTYNSETASVYGGGGVSWYWSIPSYQTMAASQANNAAMVSTTMRNLPDVVLTADASTAYAFYINGSWDGFYGSSISSPIWASFISRVNQGLRSNSPIGSVNSALYSLAQTSSYANDFHDITTGNNGYYPAEPGFDDATGLGSFNGLNLYNYLISQYGQSAPTVSITSPGNNASYTAPANITLTATASATNATISKVSFYNGTTLLGTATSSPYTYIWSNVGAGNYSLTAIATDSAGATGTSSAVSITVNSNAVPTVFLNSYIYSYTAPAVVYLKATASELGGTITKVEFYNGSTLINTSTVPEIGSTNTYDFLWYNLTPGNYSLTAKAYGSNNNVGTSAPVTFTVNGLPTVSLTANSYAATAPAGFTLTASAAEPYGTISQVEFFNGSTLLGTTTTSPYTYNWNNVPAGTYNLTAQAFDNDKNTVTSIPVTIVVNGAGLPAVTITSPSNNASYTLPATIILTASASSANATISKVAFYSGATLLGTATSSPYTYTWSNMAAGTYSITAVATDSTGAMSTSAAESITINPHIAPTVSITSPGNNASYTAPANITLTATASATNATISKVSFYNGTTLLGTATSSPYTYIWTNVSAGNYSLTAIATDSAGATGTSSAVSIAVNSNAVPTVILNSYIYSYTAPAIVYLTATVSLPGGSITKVEFYNGSTLINTSAVPEIGSTNTYDFLWYNLTSGNYSLTAKAYGSNNNVGTSAPVTFTVNGLPTVSLTANSYAATAPAGFTLTASAAEPYGTISQVEFFNGSTLLGTTTTSPYTYNWNNVPAGTYNLTAQAFDNDKNTVTSTPITIAVNS